MYENLRTGAPRLTLSHDVDKPLVKLFAAVTGMVYVLIVLGCTLSYGARSSPWFWPLMLIVFAAGSTGFGVFLLHVRREVGKNVLLDGTQASYEGELSHLLRPRLNAAALHAVLVVVGVFLSLFAKPIGRGVSCLQSMAWPFAEYLGLQARLGRTRWRGHKFSLVGPFWPYLRLCALQAILGVLTLGILYGDYAVRKRRYLFSNLRWAGHVGHYDGNEAEARRLYLRGFGLCIATLGIYTPWYLVSLRNYHLSRVSLGGLRMVCSQSGTSMAKLSALCFLANVASLGFASGWSYARLLHYQVDHLHFVGELPVPLPGAQQEADEADGLGLSDLLSGFCTFES